jgi:glycosyltransferase involved in cell wall biosynthesis
MKICLLDNTDFAYSYEDKYSEKLRGAETVLINLYQELTKIGHEVYVFNNCSNKIHNNKSKWYNLNSLKSQREIFFDVAFANADINLFDKISSNKKFVISYSLQSLEKFIRKKQFFTYFKHKPKVLVLGDYHKNKRSWITSIFGVGILELAVDEIFINTKLTNKIDKNLAIFTSRPDRNLGVLIDIWNNYIHKSSNDFKLLVTPGLIDVEHNNIIERELGSQQKLIDDLLKSRIFLIPGHKAELFCLAAEEARELCIPTVTLGIGSLSERVAHDKTGFVASNKKEFAEFTIELFTNDSLWNRIRSNLFELRAKKKWSNSVINLMQQIN